VNGKTMNEKKPVVALSLWEKWKRLGKRIGDAQARLLLSFFYFVLLSPFALALRRWSDPLAIKPYTAKGWRARPDDQATPQERAARQF
jgi:hypothetical protein